MGWRQPMTGRTTAELGWTHDCGAAGCLLGALNLERVLGTTLSDAHGAGASLFPTCVLPVPRAPLRSRALKAKFCRASARGRRRLCRSPPFRPARQPILIL